MGIHNINYECFETIFMIHLNNIAPLKTKCVRVNNAPLNKTLSEAIMTRSRLKTKYNNNPNILNQSNYKKYRNCVNLFRRGKKKYYDHLNTNLITDNKTFWKTIKPLFPININLIKRSHW